MSSRSLHVPDAISLPQPSRPLAREKPPRWQYSPHQHETTASAAQGQLLLLFGFLLPCRLLARLARGLIWVTCHGPATEINGASALCTGPVLQLPRVSPGLSLTHHPSSPACKGPPELVTFCRFPAVQLSRLS
jgi:hypothetical protein